MPQEKPHSSSGSVSSRSSREGVVHSLDELGRLWVQKVRLSKERGLAAALKREPRLGSWADQQGWTLVHWAAWASHLPSLELLLKHGAPLDSLNRGQETPLIVACRRGWPEPVSFLIDHGARAGANGLFGQSAIELLACAFAKHHQGQAGGALNAMRKLLAAGARMHTTQDEESAKQAHSCNPNNSQHRNLAARVLGEGARMDLAELAQGLVEMGERPSEQDLAWARSRGSSISVEKTRAALDREVMRDAIELAHPSPMGVGSIRPVTGPASSALGAAGVNSGGGPGHVNPRGLFSQERRSKRAHRI